MSAPDPALLAACRNRRARVLQHLRAGGGGVAILPTAPEAMRNRDATTHTGTTAISIT
ncbi:hypothetical protein ACTMU2_23010 [Cupriavidus basilensis]